MKDGISHMYRCLLRWSSDRVARLLTWVRFADGASRGIVYERMAATHCGSGSFTHFDFFGILDAYDRVVGVMS